MRLRPSVVVLGSILAVAGCAGVDRAATPTLPIGSDLPASVAPVAVDFPATAAPRPIVLFQPKLVTVEWQGLEEEKAATGYRFTGVEPPTPGPTSVVLPDGPATLPLISVRDAVAALPGGGRDGEVELVSAELGTAAFTTDRGRLELPAWRFRSSFGSVYAWPAVTPEAFWKRGEEIIGSHHARTTDGVRLEVELGAPPTPCRGDAPAVKEPVVTETETSVVIGVRTTGPVGECARTAIYVPRYYPVTLAKPLGSRVLVFEEDGGIIPVTPPSP
ncbi:hypothetical protein [Saccharothrix texasensis]|uniref:Lipoprotein n=1 Tax=Saccharothrix texasensis TaxID=103734 RepID=A0A3N1HDA4_9PSEU|nr:hypothetical protein [Saccharothrix texasensis]ROP40471.1 hypothetical protein EDD40_5883 [Saccharothrix texasensis]